MGLLVAFIALTLWIRFVVRIGETDIPVQEDKVYDRRL